MNKHGIKANQKCEFCIKSYSNKVGLKRHINKFHTIVGNDSKIQKKYKCHWCVKSFDASNSLNKHIGAFHQKWQHKCDICNKSFFKANKLIQHKMKKHGINSKPTCTYCIKTFTAMCSLKRHIINTHEGVREKCHNCNICSKSFHTNGILNQHIKKTHNQQKL